jgi:hypothetical protein
MQSQRSAYATGSTSDQDPFATKFSPQSVFLERPVIQPEPVPWSGSADVVMENTSSPHRNKTRVPPFAPFSQATVGNLGGLC